MTAPARRLLMMDDDPRACRIIERVAGGLGYEALSLHQPDRFKSAYEYFQPDVIILDLCMEQIDGVELLRFLSDRRSQAQVVLMSGMDERLLATTTNLGRSMGLDMLMPMQKPVELEALRTRLKQISNLETISQSTTCAESITANQLATAIQKNEIVIHYQPIIDLRSNRLVAAEALARWIHPDEGLVPAARFIQLAQDHGLMKPLTSKLLVAAVEAAAEWRGRLSDINLFINIPPELLQNLNLPDHVFELLRFYNFSPERLVLEVTTAQDKAHLTSTIDVLTRLRIKGVRLAYDNLGIHPSCLEPTHRLPFDILKLDPQFVSDFAHSANTVAVANSIVELAGAMNCQLVAVGIEDRTTRERLAKLGCHLGQGFGIAQPMDTREFLEWAPVWEAENPIPQPDVTQKVQATPSRSFTNALPEGYELHWYRIRSVLGSGGFGITYLAHDENLGREVAIKEYSPKDISTREQDNKVIPLATSRSKEFTD
ncbi:MAG: EAL domain-containing protein, partial [Gammaproteobacteria bacterium]|nr:EAL domain-containing protein [Gammaproteobacteria bacterium]